MKTTRYCDIILIAIKIEYEFTVFEITENRNNQGNEEINMKITVTGGSLTQTEISAYVDQLKEQNPDKYIKEVTFTVDGEYVDMSYTFDNVPFERIRRITGYLVGTVDRFNDAKRAEVQDRVKHSIDCGCSLEEIA